MNFDLCNEKLNEILKGTRLPAKMADTFALHIFSCSPFALGDMEYSERETYAFKNSSKNRKQYRMSSTAA